MLIWLSEVREYKKEQLAKPTPILFPRWARSDRPRKEFMGECKCNLAPSTFCLLGVTFQPSSQPYSVHGSAFLGCLVACGHRRLAQTVDLFPPGPYCRAHCSYANLGALDLDPTVLLTSSAPKAGFNWNQGALVCWLPRLRRG